MGLDLIQKVSLEDKSRLQTYLYIKQPKNLNNSRLQYNFNTYSHI